MKKLVWVIMIAVSLCSSGCITGAAKRHLWDREGFTKRALDTSDGTLLEPVKVGEPVYVPQWQNRMAFILFACPVTLALDLVFSPIELTWWAMQPKKE